MVVGRGSKMMIIALVGLGCSSEMDGGNGPAAGSEHGVKPAPVASSDAVATPRSPEPGAKDEALSSMLVRGPVLVHFDARRSGVVVPAKFRTDNNLVLRIGRHLKPPIPDLILDDKTLSATLMFDRVSFHCSVPLAAIFGAVVEGEPNGTVWTDDIPADLPEAQDLRSHHTPPESSK